MKKKFFLVFLVIFAITLISFLFTTNNIKGSRVRDLEIDNKKQNVQQVKIVEVIVNKCNTSSENQAKTDVIKQQQDEEKLQEKNDVNEEKTKQKDNKIDYLKKYPNFINCKSPYNSWQRGMVVDPNDASYNFSAPADKKHHDTRFIRGVLVYFPISGTETYEGEFRWLYRSWINMLKYEPPKWRTDIIVFVQDDPSKFNGSAFFMTQLNCTFSNLRRTVTEQPMCTLINYNALKNREFNGPEPAWTSEEQLYQYLLRDVDIFQNNATQLTPFYKLMKKTLSQYGYIDSILMAFEGYEYFKVIFNNFGFLSCSQTVIIVIRWT